MFHSSNINLTTLVVLCCLAACGGGGSGGSSNANGSQSLPPPPPPASSSCTTPVINGAGAFQQVTDDLGLCYDVQQLLPTTEIQVTGGGLAMSDVNRDGYLDLYVAHGIYEQGKLFLGNGNGFVAAAGNHGIDQRRVDVAGYFVDINSDGWDDFISILYSPNHVQIYLNDQTGHFEEATSSAGIYLWKKTTSLAAADYDLDGDIDLFFGHWGDPWDATRPVTEYLWENDGSGFYTDVSMNVEIRPGRQPPPDDDVDFELSYTPIFADINSDKYPDMLLASDLEASQVLINNAGSGFLDFTDEEITDENGMGASVIDYDNDGDLDWFVTSIYNNSGPKNYIGGESGNRLYRNEGAGKFTDVTDFAGVRVGSWGWGACFADFDNDGNVDIFHTNGFRSTHSKDGDTSDPYYAFLNDASVLFMSQGDGSFSERAGELGINHSEQGRGVICTDYDSDGRIDIFISNNGASPTVYHNEIDNSNNFIQIDLEGPVMNPKAIGARVTVETVNGLQMQEVVLGSNYLSQQPCTLHFGLGDASEVLSITVTWPGSAGSVSRIENVAANQRITISPS